MHILYKAWLWIASTSRDLSWLKGQKCTRFLPSHYRKWPNSQHILPYDCSLQWMARVTDWMYFGKYLKCSAEHDVVTRVRQLLQVLSYLWNRRKPLLLLHVNDDGRENHICEYQNFRTLCGICHIVDVRTRLKTFSLHRYRYQTSKIPCTL